MKRTFLIVALGLIGLSACIPLQVTSLPPVLSTTTQVPGSTLPAEPTTVPTELADSPVITPANASTLESAMQGTVDQAGSLTWSANGQALAVQSMTAVTVYRLDPITPENVLQVSEPSVILAVSPGTLQVAIGDSQNDISVKSAATGEQAGSLHTDTPFLGATLSADGTQLAVASTGEWRADVFDIRTGTLAKQLTGFETAAPVYSVRFTPSGQYMAWFARGTIQLMNIASQALGPRLDHEDFIAAFDVTLDDSRLATSAGATLNGSFTPAVTLWDPASGEKLATVPLVDTANSLSFSPDGSLLAADNGTAVTVWDTSNMTEVASLTGHSGQVVSVAFSPDGRILASLSEDGALILWHISDCNVCTLPTRSP